jgi:thymidylate synthase ThyX
MSNQRSIYLLDPKELSPETIAVAFAKTSRSPKSFSAIAQELSDESSADFHEKWVVGYGHASVAEHAVLHIAVENISRLAIECLESNRLASYTEKSSRYQKWKPDSFFTPAELDEKPELKAVYQNTCRLLFETYEKTLPAVKTVVENAVPCHEGESHEAWQARIRSDYVDVCRYLLPSGSLANVGMTINGRALEYALKKMLSHPLAEVREIGQEIRAVAIKNIPTLVKYAQPSEYMQAVEDQLAAASRQYASAAPETHTCKLVSRDQEGEKRVLAAALYRFGNLSYAQSLNSVDAMSAEQRADLARQILAGRTRFDVPMRELEHFTFTFDVLLDQGAYFELKRHRMMTQTPQPLTTALGYALPRRFGQAGMKGAFEQAMQAAQEAYAALFAFNPHIAAYIVPNAFNRRVLLTMNLRAIFHLVNLRAAANAHFAIRRIANLIRAEVVRASPLLGSYLPQPENETAASIEACHFERTGSENRSGC